MGRPREFNSEAALEAATAAFWANGYEGTSSRDLTECMGLSSSSIYAAFGDKLTLYRLALDHYLDLLRERMSRLEATLSPADAITAFFDEVIDRSLRDKLQRGCMLVNSALEASPRDAAFQDAVAGELTAIEDFFRRCFAAGQKAGEIPARHAADDAARHFLTVLLGIRVLARVRPQRKRLGGAVRQALQTLDLPQLAKDS